MAAAVPFLPLISAGVTAVGALMSASAASNAAKYNAAVAERNAKIARQQAAAEEERSRLDAMRKLGSIRAGYGASGVAMEGTPLKVLEDSAMEAELDALTIRYNGELKAMGFESDAALERKRASSAMTTGIFKAGSALLTGAGKTYGAGSTASLTRTTSMYGNTAYVKREL